MGGFGKSKGKGKGGGGFMHYDRTGPILEQPAQYPLSKIEHLPPAEEVGREDKPLVRDHRHLVFAWRKSACYSASSSKSTKFLGKRKERDPEEERREIIRTGGVGFAFFPVELQQEKMPPRGAAPAQTKAALDKKLKQLEEAEKGGGEEGADKEKKGGGAGDDEAQQAKNAGDDELADMDEEDDEEGDADYIDQNEWGDAPSDDGGGDDKDDGMGGDDD